VPARARRARGGRRAHPRARTDDHAEGSESSSICLGFFILREVAKAHGGTVEVRSDAESGTTFTIHLPRAVPGKDCG
jgi:signal transduction histidine kinase